MFKCSLNMYLFEDKFQNHISNEALDICYRQMFHSPIVGKILDTLGQLDKFFAFRPPQVCYQVDLSNRLPRSFQMRDNFVNL
jgi:hypothetical protein